MRARSKTILAIPSPTETVGNSADPAEIARFAAVAGAWWDPEGDFKPLHRLNPVRLTFIRDRLARRFGRDIRAKRPFEGLRLLDIGCGGGLVAEPLARLGFTVTGVDAAAEGIEVARAHAAAQGLAIDYRCGTAEALLAGGERFDAVTALEIVEHVVDPASFLGTVGALVEPGGAVVLSTINRTAKAWALGIVGAEYVLRWIPRGTHRWSKFLKPSELAASVRAAGLDLGEIAGMSFDPFAGEWALTRDLGVNYLMLATKG
jgi:2-polyprenyl-6-hydroxyphenyl methylase / 3-demethylubiquinone-9 3-methyltransferase